MRAWRLIQYHHLLGCILETGAGRCIKHPYAYWQIEVYQDFIFDMYQYDQLGKCIQKLSIMWDKTWSKRFPIRGNQVWTSLMTHHTLEMSNFIIVLQIIFIKKNRVKIIMTQYTLEMSSFIIVTQIIFLTINYSLFVNVMYQTWPVGLLMSCLCVWFHAIFAFVIFSLIISAWPGTNKNVSLYSDTIFAC